MSSPAHSQLPLADTPVYLSEQIATSLKDEREHVTVLFADLTGSVEWFAEGAPEEAHDLVDPMMARMTAAWIIGRGPVTRRIWHV